MFHVSVHDVTPVFSELIHRVIEAVAPMVGSTWSAAVVPQWHGAATSAFEPDFVDTLKTRFDEILLHGYFHERENGRGPLTFLTNGADELNGLTSDVVEQRLIDGQRVMSELFGEPAIGYVAPAFQRGRLTAEMLNRHGIEFLVGPLRTEFRDGRRTPLSTWCWDVGPNLTLCRLADRVSNLGGWLRPRAMPHVTIHPVDFERGFADRITRLIQSLLDEGRRPVLMTDLLKDESTAEERGSRGSVESSFRDLS